MAAVVLLGSLAPLIETTFPRSSLSPVDQYRGSNKGRLCPHLEPGHGWPRREHSASPSASAAAPSSSSSSCSSAYAASFASRRSCGCGGGGGLFGHEETRRAALLCAAWRGYSAANFRPGSANFARGGFSAGAESDEEEDRSREWEEQLRSRLKELEEMKELERRAEEVQRRIMSDEDGEEGETEEEKRSRVRKELEKLAKEQAERRETAKLMFDLGQKAYGKGMYSRAVEFLEGALTIIPRPTLLGGEIQIWLAMAYEANNRHKDCIELYQELEKKHPSISIRRQAAELRYILQAPKLKISKDEMVTIPLIGSSYDRYAGTWSDKYKDRDDKRKVTTANQLPSSKDYWGDFMGLRPPADWQRDRALWLAVTLLLAMVGFALLQG